MTDTLLEGAVLENHGALFDVLVDGHTIRCGLRGRLKKGKQHDAAPVAAGDRVEIRLLEVNRGIIERIFPRESDFSRKAVGSIPLQQTIAANIDQVVIVFAAAEPRPDFFFLDRFLVMSTTARLNHVICINKCDLVKPQDLDDDLALYRQLGYRVLCTSTVVHQGIDDLQALLKDRRSVICGPSGVGKSSLLNAIAPGLRLRVGDVGDVTHKGRHTTTSVAMLPLPFGGWIADTPGIRQLTLWEVPPEQVSIGFPDILPYLGRCRYSNCTHHGERGCALWDAVLAGKINSRRLRSFRQMGGI